MSKELEKRIEDLVDVLEKHIKEDDEIHEVVNHLATKERKKALNSGSILKYIGTILAIVVMGAGIVATWTTLKADVLVAKESIVALEGKVTANENRVRDMELKDAGDTQILKNIEKNVQDIKKKVDAM